jgi:hypothetical protein
MNGSVGDMSLPLVPLEIPLFFKIPNKSEDIPCRPENIVQNLDSVLRNSAFGIGSMLLESVQCFSG